MVFQLKKSSPSILKAPMQAKYFDERHAKALDFGD